MKDLLRQMKLATDEAGGGSVEPEKPEKEKQEEVKAEEKKEPERKYTDEDIDRIISAKFAKWESQKKKDVDEAKKLAEMNAEERASHMEKKAEEAVAKLARYEMAGTARGMLAEKNITVADELLDVLIGEDAEKTKSNIEAFSNMFDKAVDEEVEKRLKGKTPKTGASKSLTKEDIETIKDPVERQKAIAKNIHLYE